MSTIMASNCSVHCCLTGCAGGCGASPTCSTVRYIAGVADGHHRAAASHQGALSDESSANAATNAALFDRALVQRPGCYHHPPVVWTYTYGSLPGCGDDGHRKDGCVCSCALDLHFLCELAGVPLGTSFFVSMGDSKPSAAYWPRKVPVVTKARWIGGGGLLLPVQAVRYWEDVLWRGPPSVPWSQVSK